MKHKTLCEEDSSSSSSPNSIKSKKRRIYRKIQKELKQTRFDPSVERRPRSIYSKFELTPSEPNKCHNYKVNIFKISRQNYIAKKIICSSKRKPR